MFRMCSNDLEAHIKKESETPEFWERRLIKEGFSLVLFFFPPGLDSFRRFHVLKCIMRS